MARARMVALLLLVPACGGGDKDGSRNNIKIAVLADNIAIERGIDALLPVSIERPDTIGDVTLAVPTPEGVLADPVVVRAGESEALLHVAVSVSAELGPTSLVVSAVADGGDGRVEHPLEILEAAPSSLQLISLALDNGVIDYETALVYRAYALVADERLPEAYRGVGNDEDLGFAFDATNPDLPQATQDALAPFLVRPTDPTSIYQTFGATNPQGLTAQTTPCVATDPSQDIQGPFKTARIAAPLRVWVKCTGDQAADDAILASGLTFASELYGPMTTLMGQPVLDDPGVPIVGNLDSAIDFFIVPTGQATSRGGIAYGGANGVAYGALPYSGSTSSGYVVISRERASEAGGFKSTMAHEFFHILQYAHNAQIFWQGVNRKFVHEFWWAEASATWASSHFARESAKANVYCRYGHFQYSPSSLHRSYGDSDLRMYAAFVWGFWAEHDKGGPQIIRSSWDALHGIVGHDAGNQALDGVFDFETNFRKFAIANVNENLPSALSEDKRHQGLDSEFPRDKPRYVMDEIIDVASEFNRGVDIPALKASYYRITPRDPVKKVVVHFNQITQRDGLDIDVLVKKDDDWKLEDHTDDDKAVFCSDVRDIILVLSNHNVPLDEFVLGALRFETMEVPCEAAWSGTLRHELIQDADGADITLIETADVRLVQTDPEDPARTYDFVPTGTFRWNRSGTLAGCTLFSDDYHGTFGEGPAWGGLHLVGTTSPPTYYGQITTDVFNVVQHVTCPDPESNFDIEGPQSASLWLVYFNEPAQLKNEGKLMQGEHIQNSGTQHLEKWTWNLTLEEN